MFTGGASYYYHYDTLGSMRNLTNATGVTQWTDTYEPYGAIRTETKNNTSAPTNLMKFTGEYADPTGLYYLRARQYDPSIGRLLRSDPVSVGPLAFPVGSSYAYAHGEPTVLGDPTGAIAQPMVPSGTNLAVDAVASRELAAYPYLRVHDEIVEQVRVLREAVGAPLMRRLGGWAVTTDRADNRIAGASPDGNNGYADMIAWAPDKGWALIWEFKAVGQSMAGARTQINRYVQRFNEAQNEIVARPGVAIPPEGEMEVPYSYGRADVGAHLRSQYIPGIEWYRRNDRPGQRSPREFPAIELSPEVQAAILRALTIAHDPSTVGSGGGGGILPPTT